MPKSMSIKSKACCLTEKEHLMTELLACDYCSQSLDERSLCYKKAAKQSGQRSRQCLIAH